MKNYFEKLINKIMEFLKKFPSSIKTIKNILEKLFGKNEERIEQKEKREEENKESKETRKPPFKDIVIPPKKDDVKKEEEINENKDNKTEEIKVVDKNVEKDDKNKKIEKINEEPEEKNKNDEKVETVPVIEDEEDEAEPTVTGIGINITTPEEKILFDDIEKNDEIFEKIFDGIEKMKKNLSLPDDDRKIFETLISALDKNLKKYAEKLEEEIADDDIDEDEYSENVTYKFMGILENEYRRIIDNLSKKYEYTKDEAYKKGLEVVEKFVLDLGFEKGEYTTNDNIENIIEEFEVVKINGNSPAEDKKIKNIDFQPYSILYKEDDETKKVCIKGRLVMFEFKGE